MSVLKRANDRIVGVYRRIAGGGVVSSDERKLGGIFIPQGMERGAWDGSKVVADITHYPDERRDLEGKVIEVLGDRGETEAEILSIIRALGIRDTFPPQARAEAEAVAERFFGRGYGKPARPAGRAHLHDRRRGRQGPGRRRFASKAPERALEARRAHRRRFPFRDKCGGALDGEAWKRGTSVYLLNTVIPMLPERLVQRRLLAAPRRGQADALLHHGAGRRGRLMGCEIAESVISSQARFTYDEVNAIIEDNDPKAIADRARVCGDIARHGRAARDPPAAAGWRAGRSTWTSTSRTSSWTRRACRSQFPRDTAATRISSSKSSCSPPTRPSLSGSRRLGMPVVYRVHEPPDGEKMAELAVFLKNLGYRAGLRHDTRPAALQAVLGEVKGTPHENIIGRIMLRSMKKAKYSTVNAGHFGLAARHYCHFTSPIRRYPDLMVHRMVRSALRGASPASV